MLSTAASTAFLIPFLRTIGLAPASRFFIPSVTIAWARTVAVVVPSPATSLVLEATSLTSWAPIFSYGSFKSISFAIETPSLVINGEPKDLSRTTFLPFGPRVTFTVFATASTPAASAFLASTPYLISLAIKASFYKGTSHSLYSIIAKLYSTIAKISFCFTTVYFLPSNSTSVPA